MLLVGSAVFAILLRLAGLPAALMLGPMFAAILVKTQGGTIQVNHRLPDRPWHDVVHPGRGRGTMADLPRCHGDDHNGQQSARMADRPIGCAPRHDGGLESLSPGAASNMVLMAESYGADSRLVVNLID
jgi:uncharacterized protein